MIRRGQRKQADSLAPKIVRAQALLFINAVVWLGFGIYSFADLTRAHNSAPVIFLISFFFLVNAGAMVFCGIVIGRHQAWAYYLSLFIILINAIMARLGQFEGFDLLTFLFDIVILILLLTMAGDYLKKS